MIVDMEWTLQMLYVAKTIYDSGLWDRFTEILTHDFREYVGEEFTYDPDNGLFLYNAANSCVFETAKSYYNQDDEIETIVFWDPLMYRYNKLCREYEERRGIAEIENPYVDEAENAVHHAMRFGSYSYDYRWHTGTKHPKDSKLVYLEYPEFCNAWEVPRGLVELREFLVEGVKRLEAELAPKKKSKKNKIIKLPAPDKARRKEAA